MKIKEGLLPITAVGERDCRYEMLSHSVVFMLHN